MPELEAPKPSHREKILLKPALAIGTPLPLMSCCVISQVSKINRAAGVKIIQPAYFGAAKKQKP